MQHPHRTAIRLCAVLSGLVVTGGLAASSSSAPSPQTENVDALWFDGHAEVCGYRWHGSRYGEDRSGEAVAIFVTEPFSRDLHVKVDQPGPDAGDVVTAMKLNLIRDFQTGIYDYNTMTSVFVHLEDLQLMKSTFSSAEWCGHVFEEIDVRAGAPTLVTNSYFQGESQTTTLPARTGGLIGDQVLLWARGIQGAPLAPGESESFPFLTSSFERRMQHRDAAWKKLVVTRAPETTTLDLPAGRFEAIVYELEARGQHSGRSSHSGKIHIEAAAPHRLLAWSWRFRGKVLDSGELTGSKRLQYWALNREGQAQLRRSIGLESR